MVGNELPTLRAEFSGCLWYGWIAFGNLYNAQGSLKRRLVQPSPNQRIQRLHAGATIRQPETLTPRPLRLACKPCAGKRWAIARAFCEQS